VASATRKEEIRRNPLAEWLGATVRFIQAHRTAVLAGLLVLASGGAAASWYWWYQERQEDAAGRILARAYAAMSGSQPGSSANPEEATKLFQEVVQQFPTTRTAEEALIALGNLEYDSGKVKEALGTFDQYLTSFPRGRFRIMAALGKAYAQETLGDSAGAAQTLSQSIDRDKNDPLAGEVYTSLARVYEEMKKPDDAMRVYEQVVERFPQTRWAQLALQKMSGLKSK
jgi:TolA-binding protein